MPLNSLHFKTGKVNAMYILPSKKFAYIQNKDNFIGKTNVKII